MFTAQRARVVRGYAKEGLVARHAQQLYAIPDGRLLGMDPLLSSTHFFLSRGRPCCEGVRRVKPGGGAEKRDSPGLPVRGLLRLRPLNVRDRHVNYRHTFCGLGQERVSFIALSRAVRFCDAQGGRGADKSVLIK